jgi:hypothetical protein
MHGQRRLLLASELHTRLLLGGSLLLLLGVPVGIAIGNDILIGFDGALCGGRERGRSVQPAHLAAGAALRYTA